jgi:hypothetical protein
MEIVYRPTLSDREAAGGLSVVTFGARRIETEEVDIGNAAPVMLSGLQTGISGIVVRGYGIIAKEGVKAVITVLCGQVCAVENQAILYVVSHVRNYSGGNIT